MCGVLCFLGKLPWASSGSLHRVPQACWRRQKETNKRNFGHTVQFWSPELTASLSHGPTCQDRSCGWFWQGARTTLGRNSRSRAQIFSPSLDVLTQALNHERQSLSPACLLNDSYTFALNKRQQTAMLGAGCQSRKVQNGWLFLHSSSFGACFT